MAEKQTIKDVQTKILEIMKYVDYVCRKNKITYFIMGGTALGAVRHGGFIPWDDDLDIFMTYEEFLKLKDAFTNENNSKFVIQEWRSIPQYMRYAKVRMNGTTFIEKQFLNDPNLHQGIYIDIMILHKVPNNYFIQKLVYYESKYVTLHGLSQTHWEPKSKLQALALKSLKILPSNWMAKVCYKRIYKYDKLKENFSYCYWITKANFKGGLFDKSFFETPLEIKFEDSYFYGPSRIKDYLAYRYGDYMKLPSVEEQKSSVHAYIFDTEKDYTEYIKKVK